MKGLYCSSMYFIAFWSKFQALSFGKGRLQTWVQSCSPYVSHASTLWSQGLSDHRASLSTTRHTQTYTPHLSTADSSAFKVHLMTPSPYAFATAHC